MREMIKFFCKLFIIILIFFPANSEERVLVSGNLEAKITVKVFSSLTCPHCAKFHKNIYENLKKDYIDKNLVKFEHYGFPLDLAALNAELIIRCHKDSNKSFQLLGEIYNKQSKWAVGSDINIINDKLINIGLNSGLTKSNMNNCLNNENVQEKILNERIQAQKQYKIRSTPTIFINEKKYEGEHNYKAFEKAIKKFL